jgi:hypothetical protein
MKTLILIFVLLVGSAFLYSSIIIIPDDQPTIQEGIDVTIDSDTVLVQPGTYYENINYNGKNITVASLFLTTQDSTYISQTIIDGSQPSNPDSASVVTFCNEEDTTAVLCGFTIENGSGNEFIIEVGGFLNYVYKGGGIYCKLAYPRMNNLIICNNVSNRGGGIFIENNPEEELNLIINIENCKIYDNEAEQGDTYMFIYKGRGGGIYNSYSMTNIKNVQFFDNIAEDGGGVYSFASNLELNEVEIFNNQADYGAAVYLSSSTNNFTKVSIYGNIALSIFQAYSIRIFNSLLSLVNCSICNNESGIIFASQNSNINIINSILWNNVNQMIYFADYWDTNFISISFTDMENGEEAIETNDNGTVNWLEGNIDADPLFADPQNWDFHLTWANFPIPDSTTSPCIDTGDPMSPYDPDGTIADMGAYYYDQGTGIEENYELQIMDFSLSNFPNPFNPTTTINFQLSVDSEVELKIYNIKGQKVKTLVNDSFIEGNHSVIWNGKDSNGNQVGSGIYFYKLKAGDFQKVRKMILLR